MAGPPSWRTRRTRKELLSQGKSPLGADATGAGIIQWSETAMERNGQ